MIPLAPGAARHALARLGPEAPGLLALRHALIFDRPGLWADDAHRPGSLLLVREGTVPVEAFGAGRPGPAVGWLARRAGPVALAAPDDWEPSVRAEVGPVERADVLTYSLSGRSRPRAPAPTRRLGPGDGAVFAEWAPSWALAGWGSFGALIGLGAAFGVPDRAGLAALAWIYDASARFDAVGVIVAPHRRRLGLGRAAASALVAHILADRGKAPLWTTTPANAASRALAESLGFARPTVETLLRWPPRTP